MSSDAPWTEESLCAACGKPVSYKDAGGCVGTLPNAFHFEAECLLEALRRCDSERERAEAARRECREALENAGREARGLGADSVQGSKIVRICEAALADSQEPCATCGDLGVVYTPDPHEAPEYVSGDQALSHPCPDCSPPAQEEA